MFNLFRDFFYHVKNEQVVFIIIKKIVNRWRQPESLEPEREPDGFPRDIANLPEASRGQAKLKRCRRRWRVKHNGPITRFESRVCVVKIQRGTLVSGHVRTV